MANRMALEDTLRDAVRTFRQRMYTANKDFINARIDEIEAMNLPTEQAKLNMMAHFWFRVYQWPGPGATPQEKAVTRLEQVRDLSHPAMDGVWSKGQGPITNNALRAIWVEEFENCVNELAGITDRNSWIKAPEELVIFMRDVGGVVDMDLRYEGMAGFIPPVPLSLPRDEDPEMQRKWIREFFKYFSENLFEEIWLCVGLEDDYEIKTGIITGDGGRLDHWTWRGFYLYCRPRDGNYDNEDNGWAWRIVFHWSDTTCEPIPVFDSIVEFLDWYARWPERMDEDAMKEFMYGRHHPFISPEDAFPWAAFT